jgi:hypothetical protein
MFERTGHRADRLGRDASVERGRIELAVPHRTNDILPANSRSRGGSIIRSILGVARPCSFSGNTPTVAPSRLSFRNPTDRSPASPRG